MRTTCCVITFTSTTFPFPLSLAVSFVFSLHRRHSNLTTILSLVRLFSIPPSLSLVISSDWFHSHPRSHTLLSSRLINLVILKMPKSLLIAVILAVHLCMVNGNYYVDRSMTVSIANQTHPAHHTPTGNWVVWAPTAVSRITTTREGECWIEAARNTPVAAKVGETCWREIDQIVEKRAIIFNEQCEAQRLQLSRKCRAMGSKVINTNSVGDDTYFVCINPEMSSNMAEGKHCDGRVEMKTQQQEEENKIVLVAAVAGSLALLTSSFIIALLYARLQRREERAAAGAAAQAGDLIDLIDLPA